MRKFIARMTRLEVADHQRRGLEVAYVILFLGTDTLYNACFMKSCPRLRDREYPTQLCFKLNQGKSHASVNV
jgi:hypothetical protein